MSWVQLQKQQISRTLGSTLDLWKRPHSLFVTREFLHFHPPSGRPRIQSNEPIVMDHRRQRRRFGSGKLEILRDKPWNCRAICCNKKSLRNYFTSSDPHHDMLGGGCQVRVVIKNMMGRMENLRTLISGFLGLVILVRWALVTMFLSWTTQTGCRIHRTYVSLIGSGEGRHTTHLLKCVLLLSTSQTDWKQSSDVLSDISFDILSDISFDMLSDISSDILSDISKPKPNIHSFTQKAALQTLYLPHTTQQK